MNRNEPRPRRSVLYMPGSNERALEKAKTLPADALILDLEDAVAPEAREDAREKVCHAVQAGGYGEREIIIRVNGLDTPWGRKDIQAAAKTGADALLVPKISTAKDVDQAEAAMTESGAPAGLALWAMMETPLAMLHAEAIAAKASGGRLGVWVMGTNDLAKELRCAHRPDRIPMMPSLGLCLLAARAYGLTVLDGVYNDIGDEEGFRSACLQGRDLGFDGKTLIHPTQLEPCNEIFSPDADEVTFSRRVIEAFQQPENRDKGVIKIEGQMVERLHENVARRTVAIADSITRLEQQTKPASAK